MQVCSFNAHLNLPVIRHLAATAVLSATVVCNAYGAGDIRNSPDEACYASLIAAAVATDACRDALTAAISSNNGVNGAERQARLYAALAMLSLRTNDLIAARQDMDRAISIAPDDHIVQSNLGNLLLRERSFQKALETYNAVLARIVEQDPDSDWLAPLYLNRSLALRALGQYDESSKDYELYLILIGEASPPATTQEVQGGLKLDQSS